MQKCLQNLWVASVKKIYYCYETLVYLLHEWILMKCLLLKIKGAFH